ncbi:MAG: hypothetical protein WB502_06900 [Thermoactinomyces sp.]
MRIISKVILAASIITFLGVIGLTSSEPVNIAQSEPGGLIMPLQSEPGGL